MRRFMGWVFVTGLLVGLSTFGEEGSSSPIPENTSITNSAYELWAGMHEAGMIDDEQYQYVLENGCLPGGSVVTNSPVPVEEQAGWSSMAEHEVITPEELAYLLYKGTIPDMDEEELQALAELAPVYQPNRAKRIKYEVRRKHARVELIRLARRFRQEHEARTANLEERAAALGFPMKRGNAVLVGIDESDEPIYIEPDGIVGCDTISADEVWTTNAAGNLNTNFNLSGAGVVLAMWEEGRPNKYHQELAGRVTYMTAQDLHEHASAVAAVMLGAGIKTNAQGVAPGATLHAYSYYDNWEEDLAYVATNGLIQFSNHSYHLSGQYGGLYTDYSLKRDEIGYIAEYHLPVLTVSNERDGDPDGYETLANGVAKNALSVGAVEEIPGGYVGTTSVVMTSYSGWGPTKDGRIKPDVVASGWSGWVPAGSSITNYIEDGADGTSFAAPAATGSLGLLQELYDNLNGTNALLASTWKALLVHTADEAGDSLGPDYSFGWGLINVQKAAELMTTNAQSGADHFIKEFMLLDGEYSFFDVEADCSKPLKVTIAWTDLPGSSLTNDIDLRIIGPDDTVYYPFVLDPFLPGAPATTGTNNIDNVEQVVVTNTTAGFYTVVVDHKDQLADGGQWVSMVLSDSTTLCPIVDPTLSISVSTNGLPRLEWEAVPGARQAVISTDNLTITSHWATNSTISINRVTNEWIDPAGFSDPARFYKIQKIE